MPFTPRSTMPASASASARASAGPASPLPSPSAPDGPDALVSGADTAEGIGAGPASGGVSTVRGLLYASAAGLAWGTAGAAATLLHREGGLGPVAITFWRFLIGALVLLAGRFRPARRGVGAGAGTGVATAPGRPSGFGARLRRRPARAWASLAATGAAMALFHVCYQTAVVCSGLAVGTAVTLGAAPVLTALAARPLLGERLGRGGAAALSVALGGLVLLAFGAGGSTGGSAPVAGLFAALGSAAGLAGTNLLAQVEEARAAGSHWTAADRAAGGFAVGLLLLLPALGFVRVLPAGTGVRLAWSAGLIGYLGLVPSAGAYALVFRALTAVRATTVSAVLMLEPAAALVLGVTMFGEHLTAAAAGGAGALMVAVLMLARAEHRRAG